MTAEGGERAPGGARSFARDSQSPRAPGRSALVVALALLGSLALSFAFRSVGLGEANVVLAFLMGVAASAFLAGRWASVAAALLSVLAFNFFFTHPVHTFAVAELGSLVTFAVLLVTGLTLSELLTRLRLGAERARDEAEANLLLYRVGRALTSTTGREAVARAAIQEIQSLLGLRAALFLTEAGSERLGAVHGDAALAADAASRRAAEQVLSAAPREELDPSSPSHWVALRSSAAVPLGVLGVELGAQPRPHELQLLGSLAGQIGLALERELLSETAQRIAVEAEAERMRANVLATVSHDMRTPLAAISGTVSTLLASGASLSPAKTVELLRDVLGESERLTRLVENLLQMGRIQDGRLPVSKDWFPLDEVAESALARIGRTQDTERVHLDLPADLPLVPIDVELVTNVLVNLLENALRFSPSGEIRVEARAAGDAVRVEVQDSGPGLPPGDSERLFERFVRGDSASTRGTRGSGLGLAIGRAIVRAHGGRLEARNRDEGGACFLFELPLDGGLDVDGRECDPHPA